jgi:hypothetical protein
MQLFSFMGTKLLGCTKLKKPIVMIWTCLFFKFIKQFVISMVLDLFSGSFYYIDYNLKVLSSLVLHMYMLNARKKNSVSNSLIQSCLSQYVFVCFRIMIIIMEICVYYLTRKIVNFLLINKCLCNLRKFCSCIMFLFVTQILLFKSNCL